MSFVQREPVHLHVAGGSAYVSGCRNFPLKETSVGRTGMSWQVVGFGFESA